MKAQEIRLAQLQFIHSFLMDWFRSEDINKRKAENASFLIVGDFNIEAGMFRLSDLLFRSLISTFFFFFFFFRNTTLWFRRFTKGAYYGSAQVV